MAEDLTPGDSLDESVIDSRLSALLADPLVWGGDTDPTGADAIIAAIDAEREMLKGAVPEASDQPAPSGAVVELAPRRRKVYQILAAAAAALIVVVGAAIVLNQDESGAHEDIALVGTEVAPNASADADIAARPNGTRIELDFRGLDPAPVGFYYEAWLRKSPEVGVSAGTFHARGGDGSVELWVGVALADYPIVTVTLQPEGGGAASSGVVVLRGSAG